MKKYLTKANAVIFFHGYDMGSIVLLSFLLAFNHYAFLSNKIAFPGIIYQKGRPAEIISCPPGSFLNEPFDESLEKVQINDNRMPAGEMRNGIYYINLEAREGYWYPESKTGTPVKIKAFAEAGRPLQVPGPLIRVPEGTEIRAIIRNKIKVPLALYGFTRRLYRPNDNKDSIIINDGEAKEISFNAGSAGTTFYAAKDRADTLTPAPIATPFLHSQLYGAMIIDAVDEKIDPNERIFMIGMCGIRQKGDDILTKYVINGLSWPHTEKLSYRQGEVVKWRVINTSVLGHPMHLHGFPFVVNSLMPGYAAKDSIVPEQKRREVVTQFLFPMNRMRMTWVPAEGGNWLFHCHLLDHVLPASFYDDKDGTDHTDMSPAAHARDGMGGLIMGIEVRPDKKYAKKHPVKSNDERKMTLLVGEQLQNSFNNSNGKGFQLLENLRLPHLREASVAFAMASATERGASPEGQGSVPSKMYNIPGPPIILTKNQPVAITVVNNLKESTTIHWHGLEIESYYDGVAGWGNEGKRLAPLIQPGDSFTIHINPPRAGTYMYHTHMHDRQLLDGLYGPLIVLEPGETYQPETDKIILISQGSSNTVFTKNWITGFSNLHYLINGSQSPEEIHLEKGVTYRLRVINITAQENVDFIDVLKSGIYISLKKDGKPVMWKVTDQDGMNIPTRLHEIKPAVNQRNGPGTTRDFEFTPDKAGSYLFELKVDQKVEVTQVIKVSE